MTRRRERGVGGARPPAGARRPVGARGNGGPDMASTSTGQPGPLVSGKDQSRMTTARQGRKKGQRPVRPTVSSAELARRLGVTKTAITNMSKESGAPVDAEGWRWPEASRWYVERALRRLQARASTGGNAQHRDRLDAARAELAELDLAARRGETMTVSQYDEVVSGAFSRVRSRLLNLPGKLAGEGELKPREELLQIAERLVYEALEELAAGDDVPRAAGDADEMGTDASASLSTAVSEPVYDQ